MIDNQIVELKKICDSFINFLHKEYGLFIDAEEGFEFKHNYYKNNGYKYLKNNVMYCNTRPDDPEAIILHVATISEVIERNSKKGSNINEIKQRSIIVIYQYWEKNIRPKLASLLNMDINKIESDIMGDLRNIRNDILKHDAISKNSSKNVLIKLENNSVINISEVVFKEIFNEIFKYLNKFSYKYAGIIFYEDNSLSLDFKAWHKSIKHQIIP